MAGRSLFLDLRCHNDTVCRSCRLAIRQRPPQLPRTAAYSSQTSKAATRPPANDPITRRPSNLELKQYIERIKSLRNPKKKENPSFSVRYFEQNDNQRSELSSEQAFGDSLNQLDASELKNALFEIKDELAGQDEKDAFDDVVAQMGGDWDKLKTADDLEKLVTRMDAYTAAIDAEIDKTGADLPMEILQELDMELPGLPGMGNLGSRVTLPQIPEKPWTINQRKKITRLNSILARVSRDMRRDAKLTKKSVQGVYKAYHAARLSLAHGWSNMPLEVWDFLWKVFSVDESINMHRLSHIALLARDMSAANVELSPVQQLVTIEAVFVDGWETNAIESWKRCMATLGDENADTFQEFWELGVRMYCREGDLERAQRAIDKLLERQADPRILMPLIRTCSEMGTEDGQQRAWSAYRQLRELLGQDMKITDYDQVIAYFLATNQTENALYAFVDMMSDGKIDLTRQTYLPSVVANKFFFGKWLKRLIGAGDLNGALSVVEFMRKKGVNAAPIHLNGLVAAWQRTGGVEDLDRADEMAWGMIESRISFVEARRDENNSSKAKAPEKLDMAPLPRATLETFSLLAENYRMRGLHDRLQVLWQAFRDAEISPDAFMINQLIESYIQAGQSKEALELYHTLVAEQGVTPDPYTFSALWKTLGINRLHAVAEDARQKEIEATRALFAETVKLRHVFEPEGMDGQLARKILHTLRRIRDPPGLIVALTALRDLFRFLPPETLVLEMILGTTKLSLDTTGHRNRLVLAKRTLDRALVEWADGDVTKLQGERRGDALFEYLQKHYWPADADDAAKRRAFREAATQMGVYDLLKKAAKKR
ncbi:hypothetical protein EDB81DRAFT_777918 [Dactylonectria macrodidyma]|uniref:Pentatricopeptide repeat-containing protein n=1 Tax=Dactylonectria macrodidyma TaxID=307937 RepID=A0A9P9FSL6_9HYPO|nr:hypothetical protein EDB81DRAFT_777918 [Dactylonectria macrodidyma]